MMMKIAFIALISLSLLLTTSSAFYIRDIDGHPLRSGDLYNILPAQKGQGGGLGLAQTGNETCPVSVAQDPDELSHGLHVRIESQIHLIPLINEGLPLDLWFENAPHQCVSQPKWSVVEGLPIAKWCVKLVGYYDETLEGSFKIEKQESEYYKLVFCAQSGDTCGDIGIHIDDQGIRQLVVVEVNDPFLVVFKKAFDPHLHQADVIAM